MTRYGQIGWRMAAVAAFVGTAVLAIALTRAPARRRCLASPRMSPPPSAPPPGSRRGSGSARPRGHRPRPADPPGGLPGPTYYTLEFTNVSDRACSLFGYPEVSAYQDSPATGGQIGRSAAASATPRSGPKPVMLAPGATAHAELRVTADSRPAARR